MTDSLYFRQLLAGRDFAVDDPTAAGMVNFVYLIGDRSKGECVVVDPAWDVSGIADVAASDGVRITGVLATHYHPDHVGGSFPGLGVVEGITKLLETHSVKIHCQKAESEWIRKMTGVSTSDLAQHEDGEHVVIGETRIRLLHTPGHTPGSQCFLVGDRLVAGDTLFLQGCGRTDLPGGDPEEMYRSLHQRLATLGDATVLYPGHLYSDAPSATLGETRRTNYVFQMKSLADWKRLM